MVGAQATVSDIYLGAAIVAGDDPQRPGRPAAHAEAHMSPNDIPALGSGHARHPRNVAYQQELRRRHRARRREHQASSGRSAGAGRRQRRRQVDADQDPLGISSARRRRDRPSNGNEVRFASPREARAHGIETVYQDLALIGDLSVYHNMFLGREYHKRILGLEPARQRQDARPRADLSRDARNRDPQRRTQRSICCPAGSASASPSPGRSIRRRPSWCSTSRSPRWACARAPMFWA